MSVPEVAAAFSDAQSSQFEARGGEQALVLSFDQEPSGLFAFLVENHVRGLSGVTVWTASRWVTREAAGSSEKGWPDAVAVVSGQRPSFRREGVRELLEKARRESKQFFTSFLPFCEKGELPD